MANEILNVRTARKEKICCECEDQISIGDKYLALTGFNPEVEKYFNRSYCLCCARKLNLISGGSQEKIVPLKSEKDFAEELNSWLGKRVSVLLSLNRSALLKESYNGIITKTGEDYIELSINNPAFHIKTLLIRKEIILSLWEYKKRK